MDLQDEYGKQFITSAIDIVRAKFKTDGINLILTYGFKGIPGTPLLIEEMLKQSENSDMVLVDLTYTSSKNWHNSRRYKIFKKEIRIFPSIEDKLSPNPNVLLETGYAWAQKGYHRTLVIMNSAFGSPEHLPVDLKGFRWGITYKLNETNYKERNSIRKTLANDLYRAFKEAIDSESSYQRGKWQPLLIHSDWRSKDFATPFHLTQRAKAIISQLRNALSDPENPQRIIGPKNSGKTRLAYELYKAHDTALSADQSIEKILYYDFKFSDFKQIETKLHELQRANQRKILILDNCPSDIHDMVYNKILFNTPVSFLSIDENTPDNKANFDLDLEFANEIVEEILNKSGQALHSSFVSKNAKGNLREAISLIDALPNGDAVLSEKFEVKWGAILGEELIQDGALDILEEFSLFSHLSISGYIEQTEFIRQKLKIESHEEFLNIVYKLSEKGIVKITGDFVVLEAFIEELALRRLNKLIAEDLIDYLLTISKHKLSRQFGDRLIELSKSGFSQDFIDTLVAEDGLLWKYDFVSSDEGARIILSLSEIRPKETMAALDAVLTARSDDELVNLDRARRNIVWALERLAFRKETFTDASKLLFRLSIAENEDIANNATAQFAQLFQLFLAGTEANLDMRIKVLQELQKSATKTGLAVIYRATEKALIVRGWVRMGGADVQAGEKLVDYRPSNSEYLLFTKYIIDLLLEINTEESRAILKSRFSQHFLNGNRSKILSAIQEIIRQEGQIDKDLRQQFEYLLNDKKEIGNKEVDKIKKILETYSDGSIREQLEFSVSLAPYSIYRDEAGNRINPSEVKAHLLAESIVETTEWLDDLDILLSGEQRLTFSFGRKLAELKPQWSDLVNAAIDNLKSIPLGTQNNSLVEGYISASPDQDFIRRAIDNLLIDPITSYHGVRLTRFLKIEIEDLNKLQVILIQNPEFAIGLQYLDLKELPEHDYITFINWIKNIDPHGWWLAIDLCEQNLKSLEKSELSKLVKTLLMKKGILKSNKSFNPFSVHLYVDLVKRLNPTDFDDELVDFLSNEIVLACSEIYFNHEYHIKDLLDILLDNYWSRAWTIIGKSIVSSDFYGWYNLKELLKRRSQYPPEIFDWMDEYPEEAPQKAIDFIKLTDRSTTTGKVTWTTEVLEMLNRFGNNDVFLAHLSSLLHSYFYSGSLVPLFEERKNLMIQLTDHDTQAVREFAEREVSYFDIEIQRAKKNDENDSLRF